MDNKERFIEIFKEKITREGADKLLEYLLSDKCDFFKAPASTRYHLSVEGGLLQHSLNVYDCLVDYLERKRVKEDYGLSFTDESIAIVSLLHDLCKVNFYKVELRNSKNEKGVWEKVPYYAIEDTLPYGHGEKSVYIISGFMKLTRDEAFAIRYHMGFSGNEEKNTVGRALEQFPLALAVSIADMESSFYIESK